MRPLLTLCLALTATLLGLGWNIFGLVHFAASLRASQQRLKAETLRVLGADALAWMARATPGAFELVLLDPPFDSHLSAAAVAVARPLLVPGGWLYLEGPNPLTELPAGVREHRALRAGAVSAQLLQVD